MDSSSRLRCTPIRLLLSAFVCLVAAVAIAAISTVLPPPGPPSEPPDRNRIFREAPVLVMASGVETFMPFVKADQKSPTYAFNCMSWSKSTVSRSITYGIVQAPSSTLGFFSRSGQWTYGLAANRLDKLPESPDLPGFATNTMCERWRPGLVAYLNANSGGRLVGDELTSLMAAPIHHDSWLCWQNAVVLTAWLGLIACMLLVLTATLVLLFELVKKPKPAKA